MSYGSVAGVASLASIYSENGSFTPFDLYGHCTSPTLEEVEEWLEQISNALDLALENNGFITPVVVERPLPVINKKVNSWVSDLVQAHNGAGRFFTDNMVERGAIPMNVIDKEVNGWVAGYATGLEQMGIPKRPQVTGQNSALFDVW